MVYGRRKSYLLLFLIFFLTILPMEVRGNTSVYEVELERYPTKAIVEIDNMKPGDYAFRTLTVSNVYNHSVAYTLELLNKEDPTLYEEMFFRLIVGDELIFEGKLGDFPQSIERELGEEAEELLEFYFKFPEELGNEYQGLQSKFIINLKAYHETERLGVTFPINKESTISLTPDDAGSNLPQTATKIFTYLVAGGLILLIGSLIYLRSMKNYKKFSP